MSKIIAVITLIIALTAVNWSIYKKETLLAEGQIVFLKLAPVDPRSLMQGDYMALRFEMAAQIRKALTQSELSKLNADSKSTYDGLVEVELDDMGVASFRKIITTNTITQRKANQRDVNESEVNKGIINQFATLKFRLRKREVKFATNAYFFEEGSGDELSQAIYGEFRVAENGELLLVTMRDENLKKLG